MQNTDVLRRCTFRARGAKKASPGVPRDVFWAPFWHLLEHLGVLSPPVATLRPHFDTAVAPVRICCILAPSGRRSFVESALSWLPPLKLPPCYRSEEGAFPPGRCAKDALIVLSAPVQEGARRLQTTSIPLKRAFRNPPPGSGPRRPSPQTPHPYTTYICTQGA